MPPTAASLTYTIGGYTVTLTQGRMGNASIAVKGTDSAHTPDALSEYIMRLLVDKYALTSSAAGENTWSYTSSGNAHGRIQQGIGTGTVASFYEAIQSELSILQHEGLPAGALEKTSAWALRVRKQDENAAAPYIKAAHRVLDGVNLRPEDVARLKALLTTALNAVAVEQARSGRTGVGGN